MKIARRASWAWAAKYPKQKKIHRKSIAKIVSLRHNKIRTIDKNKLLFVSCRHCGSRFDFAIGEHIISFNSLTQLLCVVSLPLFMIYLLILDACHHSSYWRVHYNYIGQCHIYYQHVQLHDFRVIIMFMAHLHIDQIKNDRDIFNEGFSHRNQIRQWMRWRIELV